MTYCIVLDCIGLYCFYCIVLYCIVLYCIVLYCILHADHGVCHAYEVRTRPSWASPHPSMFNRCSMRQATAITRTIGLTVLLATTCPCPHDVELVLSLSRWCSVLLLTHCTVGRLANTGLCTSHVPSTPRCLECFWSTSDMPNMLDCIHRHINEDTTIFIQQWPRLKQSSYTEGNEERH